MHSAVIRLNMVVDNYNNTKTNIDNHYFSNVDTALVCINYGSESDYKFLLTVITLNIGTDKLNLDKTPQIAVPNQGQH